MFALEGGKHLLLEETEKEKMPPLENKEEGDNIFGAALGKAGQQLEGHGVQEQEREKTTQVPAGISE